MGCVQCKMPFFWSVPQEMEIMSIPAVHHKVEIAGSPWNGHRGRLQTRQGIYLEVTQTWDPGHVSKDVARSLKLFLSVIFVSFLFHIYFLLFLLKFLLWHESSGVIACISKLVVWFYKDGTSIRLYIESTIGVSRTYVTVTDSDHRPAISFMQVCS